MIVQCRHCLRYFETQEATPEKSQSCLFCQDSLVTTSKPFYSAPKTIEFLKLKQELQKLWFLILFSFLLGLLSFYCALFWN